jgi:hypothetical protein
MFERQFELRPLEPSRLQPAPLSSLIEPHTTLHASEHGLTRYDLRLLRGALWNVICFFSSGRTSSHVSAGFFMRGMLAG